MVPRNNAVVVAQIRGHILRSGRGACYVTPDLSYELEGEREEDGRR